MLKYLGNDPIFTWEKRAVIASARDCKAQGKSHTAALPSLLSVGWLLRLQGCARSTSASGESEMMPNVACKDRDQRNSKSCSERCVFPSWGLVSLGVSAAGEHPEKLLVTWLQKQKGSYVILTKKSTSFLLIISKNWAGYHGGVCSFWLWGWFQLFLVSVGQEIPVEVRQAMLSRWCHPGQQILRTARVTARLCDCSTLPRV